MISFFSHDLIPGQEQKLVGRSSEQDTETTVERINDEKEPGSQVYVSARLSGTKSTG